MKRTNIVINEQMVAEGKKLSGIETTRELVDQALQEFVRHHKQRRILGLRGKVQWRGDLAAMRRKRILP